MKYVFLFFVSISFISCQKELSEVVKANNHKEQEVEIVEVEEEIIVEAPKFKGGEKELFKYISEKIENAGINDDKCDKIVVKFEVSDNGQIKNVSIERGEEECLLLQEKLVEIFQTMPKWKPGLEDKKTSRCEMFYWHKRNILNRFYLLGYY